MNNPAIVSRVEPAALPQTPSPLFQLDAVGATGTTENKSHLKLAATFFRYWWFFALVWLLLAVPAVYYVMHAKKYGTFYSVSGAVQVAPARVTLTGGNGQVTPYYSRYLKTQVDLITSPLVLELAAADPRLKKYGWFAQLPDQVAYLKSHIQVYPVHDTELVDVQDSNGRAGVARDVVNSVITAYMVIISEQAQHNVNKRLQLLKQLRDRTERLIHRDNARLHRLLNRANSGLLISAGEEKKVDIKMLAATQATMQHLETSALALKHTIAHLRKPRHFHPKQYESAVHTQQDPQIAQWISQRVALEAKDSALVANHATRDHPARRAIRRQIKALNGRIAERAARIRSNALKRYQAASNLNRAQLISDTQSTLKTVLDQIAQLKKHAKSQQHNIGHLNNAVAPIIALRQQLKSSKPSLAIYDKSIQNLENQNAAPGRVSIKYLATKRGHTAHSKRMKYAVAALGGTMLLALFATLILGKVTTRIDTIDDLPDHMRPLVVGTVSNAGLSTRGTAGRMKRKILGEEMRLVHANLLPPGQHERRIIMVTSPTPGNGKTSIASHLALSLAKAGMRVLAVDGDLRKRDLSTMFDTGFKPGLAELLQGDKPELVRPVELLPNFMVMGAGKKLDRNPAELFQRKHVRECLDQIDEVFDCIIIDTPPILVVADTRLIARSSDEVLCVVRSQVSSHREVEEAVQALTRISGEMPKIVLNGVQQATKYYKYKYTYMDSTEGSELEQPAATAGV